MSITGVQARLGDTWTELSYNPVTGRWEGFLVPAQTSIHQPGGFFNVEVRAVSDRGESASISGETLAALRLVVRETQNPALTLVSPAAGYVTVKRPVVVMDAVDETGGSGVDRNSWTVLLDGAPQSAGKAVEEISGGYRLRWTPQADLGEGKHIVTFEVADLDGNSSSTSAAYIVDTEPPVLTLFLPDSHRVVDQAAITVAGRAYDRTSGISGVEIVGEAGGLSAALDPAGDFSSAVPLEIGLNTITVTAADAAGWMASETITVIRLVTDRIWADVERVRELCARGYGRWTAEERAWWRGTRCLRGSYDDRDLNRVTTAMEHISEWLDRYGYAVAYQPEPHHPWADEDAMTQAQGVLYLKNVEALRAVLPLPEKTPETPRSMNELSVPAANDIETILVAVDGQRAVMDRSSWWPSGMIACGGVF